MTNDKVIAKYMRSEPVVERFREVLGQKNAGAYIASALIAVASSDTLKACEPQSIVASALRAASLRLSVDPSSGQAYLVPFKGKATLIVGYKGLHDMAVRTGKYRYINVTEIYEGETVGQDRISGFHHIEGGRQGDTVRGWLAAFQMFDGYSKTMYMPVEEIHAHAQKYSKSYDSPTSAWKTDTAKMERKTVLRLLLRQWGFLDPVDAGVLQDMEAAEQEGSFIEAQFLPSLEEVLQSDPVEIKTEEQRRAELGFGSNGNGAAPKQEVIEEPKVDAATAFWAAAKEAGVDTATGKSILKEVSGDLEAGLKVILEQYTQPSESGAVPA